jgi:O-antigen/teichoic acid export membrane protein
LFRLVRTGFRYNGNVVGDHVIADGDKPFAARLVGYATTGSLFIAQRIADLFCLPLHAVVAETLSRLLEAAPSERAGIWRSATWAPLAYAVLAGIGLVAAGHAIEWVLPAYAIADAALAWFFWLPALVFARGMLGNAAVVAGLHEVFARSHLIGAIVRIAGAICLIGFFGWPGAIASLFLAELVPVAYLWVATRRRRMATMV